MMKLDEYNKQQEARAAAMRAEWQAERNRQLENEKAAAIAYVLAHKNGIACQCGAELGDTGAYSSGSGTFWRSIDSDPVDVSQRGVLCPVCGFTGWRHEVTRREPQHRLSLGTVSGAYGGLVIAESDAVRSDRC